MEADTVDRLIECGVFEPTEGGDELRVADEFREAVASHRKTLEADDADGIREAVATITDDETAEALCHGTEYDPEFLARYAAISERNDDLAPAQALALSVVVEQLESGQPRSEGAPEGFLPVRGENLVRLVDLYERCIVYAWRDDCPPCDVVRSDLDDLIGEDPPEDVMRLAVYGPDCAALLEEEYDLVVAPTTLFTLEGSVDVRLVGAPATEKLEREIETIRERTLPSA